MNLMSVLDNLSENIEEYLEIIYKISLEEEEPVTTSKISKFLNIAPGSVTQMLKKLDKQGYVVYSPYKGVVLTKKGLKSASKITRKHRLLERFLDDVLNLKKDKIHNQACKMEHTLSDDAERALCQFLDQPDQCPDEDLIPACDFKLDTCEECIDRIEEDLEVIGFREENLISITALNEHETGKVSFIRGDHAMVKELLDQDITIGDVITVLNNPKFKEKIELEVKGSKITLSKEMAKNIFVEIYKKESIVKKEAVSTG